LNGLADSRLADVKLPGGLGYIACLGYAVENVIQGKIILHITTLLVNLFLYSC